MSDRKVMETFQRFRIVPVIVIDDPAHASPLAAALVAGGLPCAEVTFRTPRAVEALRRITSDPHGIIAGAGTVIDERQAREARDAGAAFVVSPGFSRAVVEYCVDHEIPVFPGVCTPTDITAALGMGLSVLKFFPAESVGGIPMLRAISAPFPDATFMPTGGITPGNLTDYLELKNVVACGGSWIAPADMIAGGHFDRIEAAARSAVTLAAGSRRQGR